MSQTVFSIGGIDIASKADDAFEAKPPLTNMGGEEEMAIMKFPGGAMSIQLLGSFFEPMTWDGTLYGSNAMARAKQLDKLRTDEQPVVLQYGDWTWFGVVKHFNISINHQWDIDYRCTFQAVDSDGDTSLGAPTSDAQSLLAQAFDIATQQLAPMNIAQAFSDPLVEQFNSLQQNVNQTLQQNQNSLSNVPAGNVTALKGQVTQLQQQLQPMLASSDPSISSSASVFNNTLSIIKQTLSANTKTVQELDVQDPNLPALAAQYLGSATYWEQIVAANPGMPLDPQPKGLYRVLIPADVVKTSSGVELWM